MEQYLRVVEQTLRRGSFKENRTGVPTISTFGMHYLHDMDRGFPLLTTKSMNFEHILAENMWFLSGDPDISIIQRHGFKFWDPWADGDGQVPSAYGNLWRRFPVHHPDYVPGKTPEDAMFPTCRDFNDQIRWALETLGRDPLSRRVVVSAWAPGNAQGSALPPCHVMFVLNNQVHPESGELRLCLHVTQRSCDLALGVPYDLAGYAFLLSLFAHLLGTKPWLLSHVLVDSHVYTCYPRNWPGVAEEDRRTEWDHVPGLRKQLKRQPRRLPTLRILNDVQSLSDVEALAECSMDELRHCFRLEGYDPHPAIKFKVAV